MWTSTLIAVTTLLACLLVGGDLYEHLAVDPYWPKRPGIIQQRNGGISRRRFWLPVHAAFEVLLLVSLVVAWSRPDVRYALFVAVVAHAASRLWSLLDVIPAAVEFERTNPAAVDEAAAVRWTRRSVLRLPLDLITCAALFFALIFGFSA